ncbi:MAG: ABC transporter permease [Anaerolinea sp.]|nr:ABC transporter permease [Anaerolinea sp.]
MSPSTTIPETDKLHTPRLIIESSHGWSNLGLRDLWEYRELLVFLVWREVQGVYRQTALGISWIFLRPVLNMLVLSIVFGRIIQVPSDGIPYPIFSLAALLPWSYFSNAVTRASRSLVDNMHVISKVYFPRMVIPIAGTISGLVDFGAALLVLFVAMLIYRMPLRLEILWLPLLLLITVAFALAVGLWLATLSVKYRDVSFAITFLLQALMYASPVIYPVSMIPEPLQVFYYLNPMTGVIQGFRWALLGGEGPPLLLFSLSVLMVIIGLVSGAFIFRRTERTVVDIL